MSKEFVYLLIAGAFGAFLTGCTAGPNDPGVEYAPQMYHSVPYEPLSQITNPESGTWLDSNPEDGHGEFYNSNQYNDFGMTMREPVPGTIRRGGLMPYGIAPNDYETAGRVLVSPLDSTSEVIAEGRILYDRYCDHCHGPDGQGPAEGSVGAVFKGVPAYSSAAVKDLPEGHVFHVITYGIRRMGAHGSQINAEDRWRIVEYVQTLQKK